MAGALGSAAIFAIAHGYGLGFVAVTWSGMVWALGYERTRSLLPGMLAHAGGDLLATASFLVLLRFLTRIRRARCPPPPRLAARRVAHLAHPQHPAQLAGRHRHRAGAGPRTPGLRERGRPRGVKRHAAFHLLQDLVDVAVQDRDRGEAPQVA